MVDCETQTTFQELIIHLHWMIIGYDRCSASTTSEALLIRPITPEVHYEGYLTKEPQEKHSSGFVLEM